MRCDDALARRTERIPAAWKVIEQQNRETATRKTADRMRIDPIIGA
jgi:hypothetical protein